MSASKHPFRSASAGFTLVEIMVGMVIALIGIIVIMQVYAVFEGQRRTTTGGDDAQNDGIISLYSMQKDVAQAGYGLNSRKLFGCPFISSSISLPAWAPIIVNPKKGTTIAPITSTNPLINAIPADPNTDSLLITYGDSNNVPEGTLISGVDTANKTYTMDGGAAASGVSGTGGKGFQIGDYIFVDDGNRSSGCNTLYLTTVTGTNPQVVPVGMIPTGFVYDPVAAKTNFPSLYNMGPNPRMLAYAVINGTLSVCNYLGSAAQNCANTTAAWTPIATGIVSMRAECVAPAGIRVALVTRSSQYTPDIVTTTTNGPSWGGANPIITTGGALGSDTSPSHWGHYHYKTFETIIPMRNAVWAGAKGC